MSVIAHQFSSVAHKSIISRLNRIWKYYGGDVTGLINDFAFDTHLCYELWQTEFVTSNSYSYNRDIIFVYEGDYGLV